MSAPTDERMTQRREEEFLGGLGPRTLGEALRLLRHRTRVSRDEVARRAGVSAGAISNYENDVSLPAAPTLRRVCQVLAELLDTAPAELWEQMGLVLDRFSDSRRNARMGDITDGLG